MVPLPPAVEKWLSFLKTEKRYSSHTLAAYARDMRNLWQFYPQAEPNTLSEEQLNLALAKLHAQSKSPRSLARIASCWRSFYDWYCHNDQLDLNPTRHLKTPKIPKSLPKALSIEQTLQLLDQEHPTEEENNTPLTQARDQAMFELLYACGLRLSELVSLDYPYLKQGSYESKSWLNLDEGELLVRGKGNKTRIIPVGKKAIQALEQWLTQRPMMANEQSGNALFIGTRGKRIHPRVVESALKKYTQQRDLNIDIHPHVLRHSFASHILQSSQDLRAVQELLGHAHISTTQIYTRLDFQHLAKIYDQAHPRAKRKNSPRHLEKPKKTSI